METNILSIARMARHIGKGLAVYGVVGEISPGLGNGCVILSKMISEEFSLNKLEDFERKNLGYVILRVARDSVDPKHLGAGKSFRDLFEWGQENALGLGLYMTKGMRPRALHYSSFCFGVSAAIETVLTEILNK